MSWEDREDTTIYDVVMNHEEQYSIWPAHREPPLGWQRVGKRGPKAECLAYIEEVWTDMRPLSLRKKMEEAMREFSPRLEVARRRPGERYFGGLFDYIAPMATPLADRYEVIVTTEGGEDYTLHGVGACPPGWRLTGFAGTADACLDHIAETVPGSRDQVEAAREQIRRSLRRFE